MSKRNKIVYTEEVRRKMSESRKKFLKTEAGKEQIKRLIERNKTREYTDEDRKKASEMRKGSWSWRWEPFIINVELPNGQVEQHTFNGDQPVNDFRKMFGFVNEVRDLKKGKVVTIKRRNKHSRHPWPNGTKITLTRIEK